MTVRTRLVGTVCNLAMDPQREFYLPKIKGRDKNAKIKPENIRLARPPLT